MLRKDKLVVKASREKFDRIKFQLSFPWDSKKEFGLTFVELYGPSEKPKVSGDQSQAQRPLFSFRHLAGGR